MSNKTYDIGRKLVEIWIPALAALYFGLGKIWDFPATAEVIGSLAVIATFLGAILGISNRRYYATGAAFDGQMHVLEKEDGTVTYSLELDGDPADFVTKDSIAFKVEPGFAPPENPPEV